MFVILLVLWLVFAGSLTVTNLILGVLVAGLITLLCTKFMGYSTKRFYGGLKKAGQPKPTLVHFRGEVQSDPLRVLVANSITLTPGTYTVRLEGDEYAVHALDEYFQVDIEYSAFFKMAQKVEES